MIIHLEQEKTKLLVKKVVEGDCNAFGELERLAKPLLVHLADYYSSLHRKFEYDDFYSICLNALYQACLEYDPKNPSFLSYAKTFMLNQCNRELEYWNAEMRNIFNKKEVMIGLEREIDIKDRMVEFITVEDEVFKNEFRENLLKIINSLYNETKATVLKLYIFYNMRPRDITDITGLEYHNVYTIIRRGMRRIADEYKEQYSLDIIRNL